MKSAKYQHSAVDWDASLARLLKQLEEKTSSVTYKQMLKNGDDATAASFNLEVGWHARPAYSLAVATEVLHGPSTCSLCAFLYMSLHLLVTLDCTLIVVYGAVHCT